MKPLLCFINYRYQACMKRKETAKSHGTSIYKKYIPVYILTEEEKHRSLDSEGLNYSLSYSLSCLCQFELFGFYVFWLSAISRVFINRIEETEAQSTDTQEYHAHSFIHIEIERVTQWKQYFPLVLVLFLSFEHTTYFACDAVLDL